MAAVHVWEIETISAPDSTGLNLTTIRFVCRRVSLLSVLLSLFELFQVVLHAFCNRLADLPCIRPGYTSSGLSPARGFSAPRPTGLSPHGGTPFARRTARIQTGLAAGTAYSSARNTPSAPAPVYPSPARCRPVAAFLHIP